MSVIYPSTLFMRMSADIVKSALASASPPSFETLEQRLWAAAEHDAFILGGGVDSLLDASGNIRPEGREFADTIQAVLRDYQREME